MSILFLLQSRNPIPCCKPRIKEKRKLLVSRDNAEDIRVHENVLLNMDDAKEHGFRREASRLGMNPFVEKEGG
jgi:hypothetical protein